MSDIEFGTCDFCKEEKSLERTYIHGCDQVDGKCDGFIIIHHCSDCQPREIQHLTEENEELKELIYVDNDECRLDHHGHCQTHSMGEDRKGRCAVVRIREMLESQAQYSSYRNTQDELNQEKDETDSSKRKTLN